MQHELDQARTLNENNVRVRADGKGDAWANMHRDELGNMFHMHDVDGLMGTLAFAKNTGDRLFVEYEPDSYLNRDKVLRRFGIVALFDRKQTDNAAFSKANVLSTAFYLYICRVFAEVQNVPPKFFYVIGHDRPPWRMVELDINTGEQAHEETLTGMNWRDVWRAIGLIELREQVKRWALENMHGLN